MLHSVDEDSSFLMTFSHDNVAGVPIIPMNLFVRSMSTVSASAYVLLVNAVVFATHLISRTTSILASVSAVYMHPRSRWSTQPPIAL